MFSKAQMASNDYPNIVVNVALSVRTIVAFLPYYVQGADLPAPLGDILYVATNIPAQLVAFATGVYGARLFPILPPPPGNLVHPGSGGVGRGGVPHRLRRGGLEPFELRRRVGATRGPCRRA